MFYAGNLIVQSYPIFEMTIEWIVAFNVKVQSGYFTSKSVVLFCNGYSAKIAFLYIRGYKFFKAGTCDQLFPFACIAFYDNQNAV